jgi:hypothetical protein
MVRSMTSLLYHNCLYPDYEVFVLLDAVVTPPLGGSLPTSVRA